LVEEGQLVVCLPLNGGVMSGRRSDGGTGLDYDVALKLADFLDLNLKMVWFEAELDEESSELNDSVALLSEPMCDAVPGHALYEPSLGTPLSRRAALPRWKKNKNRDLPSTPTFVDLRPIDATAPYARIEMGFVLRESLEIQGFEDIEGLRLGVQEGTLAGAISLLNASDSVRSRMVSVNPGPLFLWDMEKGEFDVALVSTAEYDYHKQKNPLSTLKLSSYRHPLGFNIGMAVLQENSLLKEQLDRGVRHLRENGFLEAMFSEKTNHFVLPESPFITPRIQTKDLH